MNNTFLGLDEFTIAQKVSDAFNSGGLSVRKEFSPISGNYKFDFTVLGGRENAILYIDIKKIIGFSTIPSTVLSKARGILNILEPNSFYLLVIISHNIVTTDFQLQNLKQMGANCLINPTSNDIVNEARRILQIN